MNDDRMVLDAAKAAGIKALRAPDGSLRNCTGLDPAANIWAAPKWSPLTDDGDAFRLAVARNIGVQCHVHEGGGYALASHGDLDESFAITVEPGDDPAAATRRAIVRAAAALNDTA